MPDGAGPALDDLGLLIKGDGEPNAWPRSKRRGAVNPKYRSDLAGDEGKGTAKSKPHTLAKHVDVTTRDLRARLRANPRLKTASRYIDVKCRSLLGWTVRRSHPRKPSWWRTWAKTPA